MQNLAICGVQYDIIWNQPKENCRIIEDLICEEDSDVYVLPEMFNTGFCMQPDICAETMDGVTVSWMRKMAKRKNALVIGSLAIIEKGIYFNRLVFCAPDKVIDYYDKIRLFSSSDEHKVFKSGTSRKIIEWKGWKILGLICYDLRFPELARNNENYDLCVYVSSWPTKRNYAWEQLLIARAIENQCYVIGVNRIGSDSNGYEYSGPSIILNFLGKKMNRIGNSPGLINGTLNQNKMLQLRSVLPALRDAKF